MYFLVRISVYTYANVSACATVNVYVARPRVLATTVAGAHQPGILVE